MSLDEMDQATSDAVVARRNMMLGVWAGAHLGYQGESLARYVQSVIDADHLAPGPDDVIEKILGDFLNHGIRYNAASVTRELQRMERRARDQLMATD